MKTILIRSKKLLNAARGQSCVNCGKQDGTIVAAHYQGLRSASFGKGKGIKPHDLCVADLCSSCHKSFDNAEGSQFKDVWFRKIDLSEQFMFCIILTLIRRVREGVITIEGMKK